MWGINANKQTKGLCCNVLLYLRLNFVSVFCTYWKSLLKLVFFYLLVLIHYCNDSEEPPPLPFFFCIQCVLFDSAVRHIDYFAFCFCCYSLSFCQISFTNDFFTSLRETSVPLPGFVLNIFNAITIVACMGILS